MPCDVCNTRQSYALSCYMYIQNDFGPSKLFWTGTNCFGWVQIILVRFILDFSGFLWFGPDQNQLDLSKTIRSLHKILKQLHFWKNFFFFYYIRKILHKILKQLHLQ